MQQTGAMMPDQDIATTSVRHVSTQVFHQVEHGMYVALALLLCATGLLALAGAAVKLWLGLADWTAADTVFVVIDRLLCGADADRDPAHRPCLGTFRRLDLRAVPGCRPDCLDPARSGDHVGVIAGDAARRHVRQFRKAVPHLDDRVGRAGRTDPGDGYLNLHAAPGSPWGNRGAFDRRGAAGGMRPQSNGAATSTKLTSSVCRPLHADLQTERSGCFG